MKGLSESNVPRPAMRTSPPLGAAGLTYSRLLASAGYLRSPWVAKPWLTTVPDAVWARRIAVPLTQRPTPPASTWRRLILMTRAPEPDCTRYIARPSWAALWPRGYFAVGICWAERQDYRPRHVEWRWPGAAARLCLGLRIAGKRGDGPPCEFDFAMAAPQPCSMVDSHLFA